jgi:hypothetical protein
MKTFTVKLRVAGRRFIPGEVRTAPFQFEHEFISTIVNKTVLLNFCMREFGRCTGVALDEQGNQTGWTFEGKEKSHAGEAGWWETRVEALEGFARKNVVPIASRLVLR